MRLDDILREGIKLEASDIHLTVDLEPKARINGKLKALTATDDRLSADELEEFVRIILDEKELEELQNKGEVDASYRLEGYRFRVNVFKQRGTYALVLRIIPKQILSLEKLGLPTVLEEVAEESQGLFLVTGPTGSGKSTTLASIIDLINRNQDQHIITLEDP
ncbi:MAG: type IV pilus twitching motility protein PilT, partial [Bacillota bacterium]